MWCCVGRTRHNQYNSDVDTKAMRASAPLIPVWDDHEYTKCGSLFARCDIHASTLSSCHHVLAASVLRQQQLPKNPALSTCWWTWYSELCADHLGSDVRSDAWKNGAQNHQVPMQETSFSRHAGVWGTWVITGCLCPASVQRRTTDRLCRHVRSRRPKVTGQKGGCAHCRVIVYFSGCLLFARLFTVYCLQAHCQLPASWHSATPPCIHWSQPGTFCFSNTAAISFSGIWKVG